MRGFLESGWREPADLTLTSRREERRTELAERYGAPVEADNAAAAADAALVIVAVKPQDAAALLAEIGPALSSEHTLLSVAAALSTDWYESRLPEGVPVIRAMPNTPAIVREGIAAICAGAHADEAHLVLAEDALRHLGPVVRVAEPYMDVVTAVSGSGPAYFSLLVESMIEAGVLLGLSREIASQLVIQTMLGTAKLLRDEHMHPVALREAVTSPGGHDDARAARARAGRCPGRVPERDPRRPRALARARRRRSALSQPVFDTFRFTMHSGCRMDFATASSRALAASGGVVGVIVLTRILPL